MIASNDTPVTDAELDSFYGISPTQYEVNQAIITATRGFDCDDLSDIAMSFGPDLLADLADGNVHNFFSAFKQERAKMIANRASIELFGKTGVIKPEEV